MTGDTMHHNYRGLGAGDQAVVDIYGEHTEIHSNNYDGIYI